MESVALLFMSVKQKRMLAQSKGKNIRISDYYIWSADSSSYINGGPYYLINDDSLGTSTRIVCALRGDEADREADDRNRKNVTLIGKIEQYSTRSGLFIDPCHISTTEHGTPQSSKQVSLTVKTTPANARVRIMNIVPKYQDGIKLNEGKYHIEVSAEGYETYNEWHVVDSEKTTLSITLEKRSSATNEQINEFRTFELANQPYFEISNNLLGQNSKAVFSIACGNEASDNHQFFGTVVFELMMLKEPSWFEKVDIHIDKEPHKFIFGGPSQTKPGLGVLVGVSEKSVMTIVNLIRKYIDKSAGDKITLEVPNARRKHIVLDFSDTQAKDEFSKFVDLCRTYRNRIGKGINVPAIQ